MPLTEKPDKCPLCGGTWIQVNEIQYDAYYICPNAKKCRITLMTSAVVMDAFYLKKYLDKGTEVWWSSIGPCEYRRRDSGFKKIDFMLPFKLTEERLNILLLFS
jgi:hypothetical protein